jgi:phage shock protein A
MSLGRRLTRIVRVRRETRGPQPDPMVTLERAQLDQEDRLDQARRAVADLVVQRRRVELLAVQVTDEMAALNRRAEEAVGRGDDAAARELLRRSIVLGERRETLHAQHTGLDAQVRRLEHGVGQIERRVEESRIRYLALRADHDAARAATEVRGALGAAGRQAAETRRAAQEAERTARELQARAAAYDELAWTDPDAPAVREAFEELEHGRAAEEELARLKERRALDP